MSEGILRYFCVLSVVALAGCATQVTPSGDPKTANPYFAAPQSAESTVQRKAGDVTLDLSEEARNKLADNLKFNQETLLNTVRRALEANRLVVEKQDATLPKIAITITDVRVRSNFSAS